MSSRLKTMCLSALAAAVAVVGVMGAGSATAQQAEAKKASKVGLIDMAEVFRKYDKFTALREDLKNEMVAMDTSAKPKMEELNSLTEQMKSNDFEAGSPAREQAESRLFTLSSELEALRKKAQVDVMRKESDIYKDIYLEVQQVVAKYSAYYGYDVVLRFNSNSLEDTNNPQAVLQQMNRQVVHHSAQDDITNRIIEFLNKQYAAAK